MKQFLAGILVAATGAAVLASTAGVLSQDNGGKGMVVKAPFTVMGASGEPIMDITEAGEGAVLTVYGADGAYVKMGSSQIGMAVSVRRDSQHLVSMFTNEQDSIISAVFGENMTSFKVGAQEQHMLVGPLDKPLADLGVKPGTNSALRIAAPNGTTVASLGSSASLGDAGALYVGNSSGTTTAYVASEASNTGIIGIAIGGQDVVRLEQNISGSGGKVTIADTGGNVMFNAGVTTDGNGTACVLSLKTGRKCF